MMSRARTWSSLAVLGAFTLAGSESVVGAPRPAAEVGARSVVPPATAQPMTAANRTEGVAPLAVFFDCVDTVPSGPEAPFRWTSGVHQPEDGDYEAVNYVWDFGDAAAGVWSTTGSNRNAATGYTAAHVYESPGVYTATLTVVAKTGAIHLYSQTITVRPFSGTTYYVAADGNDANRGTDPATPFATVARGAMAVNRGSNRRLLLRRGDVFTTPGVVLTAAGPGIVGAYGTGDRPILNVVGSSDGIAIRGADWRVMDLDVRYATAGNHDPNGITFVPGWPTVDALVLRVKTTGFRDGILNTGTGRGGPPHDGIAFVDCEVARPHVNGLYVGGRRIAVLGCDVHDIATSHVLRMWQGHKAVISGNRLWNPGPTRHALKLPGPTFGDGRPETRWVTVTDNLIRGKVWSVAIGPEDKGTDTRVSHVVYERNRHWPESSVGIDLTIWARDVMVRNNIFDASGVARSYRAIQIGQRGVEPIPDRVRVFYNTIVRNDAVPHSFRGVDVQSAATNVTVRGNLMAAPLVPRETRLAVDHARAGAGFLAAENFLTTPAEAYFTDLSTGDFSVTARSRAIDAGAALPEVRSDFRGVSRPRGRAFDLGALESR